MSNIATAVRIPFSAKPIRRTPESGTSLPLMARISNSAGQYWKFTQAGGCYRLSNVLLVPGYALDNYPTGSHPLWPSPAMSAANDGYLRLSND
jgi:hypothetical protein